MLKVCQLSVSDVQDVVPGRRVEVPEVKSCLEFRDFDPVDVILVWRDALKALNLLDIVDEYLSHCGREELDALAGCPEVASLWRLLWLGGCLWLSVELDAWQGPVVVDASPEGRGRCFDWDLL